MSACPTHFLLPHPACPICNPSKTVPELNEAFRPSKTKLVQLQDALNLYGRHLDWCQRLAQMPTEPGRTYMYPTDWDNWRTKQPCTCKWDDTVNALVRGSDETFDVRNENRKLCAKEGHVLGVIARPCLRCHEWFDPQYGTASRASVTREQANAIALECAQSTRRSVDAIQASEKAAASAVLNLACEQFTPDPNSRFCDKCGYPQHDHRRAVKAKPTLRDCICVALPNMPNPMCPLHGSVQNGNGCTDV